MKHFNLVETTRPKWRDSKESVRFSDIIIIQHLSCYSYNLFKNKFANKFKQITIKFNKGFYLQILN